MKPKFMKLEGGENRLPQQEGGENRLPQQPKIGLQFKNPWLSKSQQEINLFVNEAHEQAKLIISGPCRKTHTMDNLRSDNIQDLSERSPDSGTTASSCSKKILQLGSKEDISRENFHELAGCVNVREEAAQQGENNYSLLLSMKLPPNQNTKMQQELISSGFKKTLNSIVITSQDLKLPTKAEVLSPYLCSKQHKGRTALTPTRDSMPKTQSTLA